MTSPVLSTATTTIGDTSSTEISTVGDTTIVDTTATISHDTTTIAATTTTEADTTVTAVPTTTTTEADSTTTATVAETTSTAPNAATPAACGICGYFVQRNTLQYISSPGTKDNVKDCDLACADNPGLEVFDYYNEAVLGY
jgi:hypothetical protein